jgi:hypothetical protein
MWSGIKTQAKQVDTGQVSGLASVRAAAQPVQKSSNTGQRPEVTVVKK